MKFSARFIALFFVVIFCVLFVPSANAQTISPTPEQSTTNLDTNLNANVPHNFHTFTQSMVFDLISSTSCILSGVDVINVKQPCLGPDPQTGKLGYVKNDYGVIGSLGNMIGMLYTPPARVSDYTRYMASNFGVAPKALAASDPDYGFTGLSPFLNIWAAFRNMVYLVFIVIFVVIGFSIMLRVKIDPRTVMTIQNQIPKIVVGILLVTFSYAIAAFLIDVMWASTYLAINIFSETVPGISSTGLTNNVNEMPLQYVNDSISSPITVHTCGKSLNVSTPNRVGSNPRGTNGTNIPSVNANIPVGPCIPGNGSGVGIYSFAPGGILGIVGSSAGYAGQEFFGLVEPQLQKLFFGASWFSLSSPDTSGGYLGHSIPVIGGILDLAQTVGTGITGLASHFVSFLLSAILGGIVFLILLIAIIVALFRLWFGLLKCYIFILMDVALAPWWILFGLMPGASGTGFGPWLRTMMANLSVFPATLVMLLLGKSFMIAASSGSPFVPPFIGGAGNTGALSAVIGIGFILASPGVIDKMKGVFKPPERNLKAFGQSVGAGNLFSYPQKIGDYSYKAHMANQGIAQLPFGIGKAWTKRFPGGH